MLGWFRSAPRCPVQGETKAWIETGFTWLTNEFGVERVRFGKVVEPTIEFFPASYEGTEQEIHAIMTLIAKHMDLDANRLRLQFYRDDRPVFDHEGESEVGVRPEPTGGLEVWLDVSKLDDPLCVVALISHEISHALIKNVRQIEEAGFDPESLADLLAVYMGLGIFTANESVQDRFYRMGRYSEWSTWRESHLSLDAFGYVMAIYALARGETKPAWAHHLRPDVRGAMRQGIGYIMNTGDCNFPFFAAKFA